MNRTWIGRAFVLALVAVVGLGAAAANPETNEPLRVFEAAGRQVVIDASTRTMSFDGASLAEASSVADATVMENYLFVARRGGEVLVYELPAPETDGVPALVQRLEGLGRDARSITSAADVGRVLLLSAGTTEIFGIRIHDRDVIDGGEVDDPAYVDHARFLDFIRDEDGNADEPRAMAVGPRTLALATDKEVLELVYPDRSYNVVTRAPLPEGVARIDAIAYTGSHWVFTGLSDTADPVLMAAAGVAGPWSDLGVLVVDQALKGKDGPIAWLPGGFTVEDGRVHLAIRGERGAVASWPASLLELTNAAVEVRWLGGAGDGG